MDAQEREWVEEAMVDFHQDAQREGFSVSNGQDACC
jgi:Fe-S cluster assembly iron-binding protein IscA